MEHTWRVLLVEDDYDSIKMVSKILTYHGVEVHVVNDGRECLQAIDDLKPSVIVTDLAMPDMNGWQTLAAIRSNPQTAHIPVVAITAYHSPHVAEEVQDAGFDAYFSKPINPRSFVQHLAKLVEG